MKNLISLFLAIFSISSNLFPTNWITNAEDVTYEFLTTRSDIKAYTEHVAHLKRVFDIIHIKTFLEFGVGFSTKYFIDRSDHVISVEIVTPGSGPAWLQYCIDLYRNCPSWTPIAYFSGAGLETDWAPNKYIGADSVYEASAYQPVNRKSYAPIDPSFLDDLNNFVNIQVASNEIDFAFVDSGVCIRGDLVQVLFDKVPIIAAHDVDLKERRHLDDVYGYGRIIVPENYVEIYIQIGMGTCFWIKNEPKYFEIIQDLQNYAIYGSPI